MGKKDVNSRVYFCCVCTENKSKIISTGTDFQYGTTDKEFRWHECENCGHFFLNPVPHENSLDIIYPKNLGNYEDFDTSPGIGFKIKRILDKNSLKKVLKLVANPNSFLDVGCAAGTLLDLVKECNSEIKTLHGVEISNTASKLSTKKGYKIFHGTIEKVDLKNNKYDFIYLQQVIEHVHDPNLVLRKLYKHLQKNGIVVLETPSPLSWDHKIFKKRYWEGYHFPRHFNIWKKDGMIKLLEKSGFKIISTKYRIKPVNWTLSIQNWIIDKKKLMFFKDSFNMNNKFPIFLFIFGIVDLIQLILTKKSSDLQYIATKK